MGRTVKEQFGDTPLQSPFLSLGPIKSREEEGKEGDPKELHSRSGGGRWSFPSKGPGYSRTTEPAQGGF